MRIVHVNLERTWRGGERQVVYLMEGLARLGHECHLVARKNGLLAGRAREKGIPVLEVRKPFVARGFVLGGFDVVHAHETRALQMAALWKGWNTSPVVFTRRVDNPPSTNPVTRLVYGKIDRMAVISRRVGEVMASWGFDPGRTRVIPSSVHPLGDPDDATVSGLRRRFDGRKVVGCIAALEKRKDHATLLRAASVVSSLRDDVVFVLVGDGDMRAELEAEARALRLANVVFEGYRDDLAPYYRVFDVFLLTSRQEGLGSSILDAMACGVPVVATRAGGIPEIVHDGETGLLVDVGDAEGVARAVLRMLHDERLRRGCIDAGRRMVREGYTVEAMAKSYHDLYAELVQGA
ncbi:MAG TPA: glycosyltransferase family 4 protein [Deltaproteobacteria bacterium]|nr:glycosyltransferase family 4 protein [Deltaproteobacteria bacterium]HPP79379.1 glycosyltransferase family 4 protein [Deltaproteobacteria bacterium]